MYRDESRTDLGTVKIHNNVIASIAAIAATEIEGTLRIGSGFAAGLFDLMGKRVLSSIKVEISKNDTVRVDVPIVVKYGFNIPEIASKVQENVRSNLEKMTNLSIRDINVTVQGIERG